ncbi:roadblock/LC7 domain-containing protein [Streptomyces nanshensis]|uniref:roadblock/LC7 domain-containing protein n=1 Tax=Streptomyces nanshensis TaxID=518642 RepID=UPI0014957DDA|nr:roadblock/LC7 domain-containing protein [Streptomyces nanshensis]
MTEQTRIDWLLERFLTRVPETVAALLTSPDGLLQANAHFTEEQAETMAAIVSGQYSLAGGATRVLDPHGQGAVRQIVVEHDAYVLFVMSAGAGLVPGQPAPAGEDPETVSTLLGVATTSEADAGLVGHEAALLAGALGEHLVIPTRRGSDDTQATA